MFGFLKKKKNEREIRNNSMAICAAIVDHFLLQLGHLTKEEMVDSITRITGRWAQYDKDAYDRQREVCLGPETGGE